MPEDRDKICCPEQLCIVFGNPLRPVTSLAARPGLPATDHALAETEVAHLSTIETLRQKIPSLDDCPQAEETASRDASRALATAHAHRHKAVACAAPLQLMEHLHG
jgi:hypothetical protein